MTTTKYWEVHMNDLLEIIDDLKLLLTLPEPYAEEHTERLVSKYQSRFDDLEQQYELHLENL